MDKVEKAIDNAVKDFQLKNKHCFGLPHRHTTHSFPMTRSYYDIICANCGFARRYHKGLMAVTCPDGKGEFKL